jgi:hypothetical protein
MLQKFKSRMESSDIEDLTCLLDDVYEARESAILRLLRDTFPLNWEVEGMLKHDASCRYVGTGDGGPHSVRIEIQEQRSERGDYVMDYRAEVIFNGKSLVCVHSNESFTDVVTELRDKYVHVVEVLLRFVSSP